jgi:hypothetical protein
MTILNYLQKLQAAGLPVVEADDSGAASFSRELTSAEKELLFDITDPTSIVMRTRKKQAWQTAKAIPSWATWTQAEADAWATTNIATPLATARTSLPATLTLATARAAFVVLLNILDKMWQLQKANAQMTLAIRDEIWPDLPER